MKMRKTLLATLILFAGFALGFIESRSSGQEKGDAAEPKQDAVAKSSTSIDAISGDLLFTTYFYTAGEAIIHGFEDDTEVRLISVEQGGTVFTGKVNATETKLVKTGQGVFSFVANKKASILVGTPSSCAVVGYWLRDQNGSFRASRLFSHLPSNSSHSSDCRIVIWAWDEIDVTISDVTADAKVDQVAIKKGAYHEIVGADVLGKINNHVIDFQADKPAMSVQVYYDEGYFVPAESGRGAGRLFYTYVGTITNQKNDLNLISYYTDAKATATDVNSGEEIWSGTVKKGSIHTLTLEGRHVKVTSDVEISVLVAPYEHYKSIYAEHHFGVGGEGTGIEREFLLTTTQELWIFSYYPGNNVRVFNAITNELVWKGMLNNGQVQGVHPGHGFFRVEADKGVSVMGGAANCGAEFSPATGLFAIDEALFKVVQQIREDRRQEAAANGQKLSDAQLNAPLSSAEAKRANDYVKQQTGRAKYSDDEVNDRLREIQENQKGQQNPGEPKLESAEPKKND